MPTTRVIAVDSDDPDPAVIAEAAAVLRSGRLVAFATETVYGLGADATHPEAVARIFEAKGRPSTNPLIVHVQDKAAAMDCVADWPIRADRLADRFWPGPLTLVLPRSPDIPDIVTAGQDTVGVRVPRPNVARALIRATARPIAAPSANRSTGISPTLARHVLKDLDGKIDLILDSGPTDIGLESTVLDLSGDRPRILRPGEITREQIAEALGEPVAGEPLRIDQEAPFRSPGQMEVHYSPRTPAFRVEGCRLGIIDPNNKWAFLSFGEQPTPPDAPAGNYPSLHIHLSGPAEAARTLYARLHECDHSDKSIDFILIAMPPDKPEWQAVRDRLKRATRIWMA